MAGDIPHWPTICRAIRQVVLLTAGRLAPTMAASGPRCVPPELLATLPAEAEVHTVTEGLMSRYQGRVALPIWP